MKYRNLLYILFILLSTRTFAQEFAYVNTDNLILRDRPEKTYRVQAVLHPAAEVEVEPYLRQYQNNKKITDRFYRVRFTYRQSGSANVTTWYGWVEKQYTVGSLAEVTATNKSESTADVIYGVPYMGSDEHNPNEQNRTNFPYPKYKGGDKHIDPPFKKVYHRGIRGGCYYINPKGHKQYVDAKFCSKK